MTSQSLLPNQLSGKGTAVASDFRLPWNTARSMADVWAAKPERQKAEPRPRAKPESHDGRASYAGRDDATYVLRDWQGSYLHASCQGMTASIGFAWRGSSRQLDKVRQKFPNTKDLVVSAMR